MPHIGREGNAKIALLTIVDEEFEITRDLFGLHERINGTEYFTQAQSPNRQYDVVLRRASDRANSSAEGAIMDFVEDFFPPYFVVIGIAGGAIGRDEIGLGDVVVADFIEYYEFMKVE